ncbi:3292_t:CDS:2 [Funneliformis geosporum]|uniref:3292_t:CDS:1 n=1 Tax=Funneliformis geosporum TaxID=1117311 RepID=A0A9W4SG46_9GLOM|nr:3292_t:CDS:2 [Funneliformis geosporum]
MAEDEEVRKKVVLLDNKILMLENNVKKMKFTITTAGDIGILMINIAEINQQFLYDLLNSNSKIRFDDLIIPNEFHQPCERETEVQKRFMNFFEQFQNKPWFIKDTSTKDYFKGPIAKINVAVLDGSHSLWSHIVTCLELKIDLSRDYTYHEVLGQLNERFTEIFDQQPDRKYVIGAVCGVSIVEIMMRKRNGDIIRSGKLSLKEDVGLHMLVNLVTASNHVLDYQHPGTYKDMVKTVQGFTYHSILRRTSDTSNQRISFVLAGEVNSEPVILKASSSDHEIKMLQKLFGCEFIPKIVGNLYGTLTNGEKFMVIRPFGEHLEVEKHGLKTILMAFRDITKAIKFAYDLKILHRDISFGNIILFQNNGYLIDWGVASNISDITNTTLTATLLFSSIKVTEQLAQHNSISYTIEDDLEALYFTLVYIACDGVIVWKKSNNLQDIVDFKLSSIVKPDHQLKYARQEFRTFLDILRKFIFPESFILSQFDWRIRKLDIDKVINVFEDYLKTL